MHNCYNYDAAVPANSYLNTIRRICLRRRTLRPPYWLG